MHLNPTLTILLPLLFTLTTTSTPLHRRNDASTIISDLDTISADIADFDAAVASFKGTLLEALAIQTKETKIEDDIQTAITHTEASAAFTASESTSVTDRLLDLEPEILGSLVGVVEKVAPTVFVLL